MTNREREEVMEQARAKRRRKKPKEAEQPEGVVEQVKQVAADAARAVGTALKPAADLITGTG
jgi:hypothetical protein